MVGIFDKFKDDNGNPFMISQEGMNSNEEPLINAPLPYMTGKMQHDFHKRAKSKSLMSVTATSPDFKKLMKKFGKSSKGRPSAKPIEFVIYNDASRAAGASDNEKGFNDRIYYPKFVEYGYTKKDGTWVDGQRLYAKTRDQFRQFLIQEYRAMPSRYTRQDIKNAFGRAVERYKTVLESVTPLGVKWNNQKNDPHMKDMWKSESND